MEQVTRNRKLGRVRLETWQGRRYHVAPATLVVTGVLPGSNGPLFYPAEELARNADAWNGMPLVLGHPTDANGRPTSARHPQVLEKFGLGAVYNVTFSQGKLRGEVWFDEAAVRQAEPRLLEALHQGAPLELSTGLFLAQTPQEGTFNGRAYKAIATDYRPDHLAILLNDKGACSLADGCGVLVNRGEEDTVARVTRATENAMKKKPPPAKPSMGLDMTPEKACKILEDGEVGGTPLTRKQKGMFGAKCGQRVENDSQTENEAEASSGAADEEETMALNRKKAVAFVANCDCWKGQEEVLNALSDEQLARLAQAAQRSQELLAENAELVLTANAAREALDLPDDLTGNHLTIEIREKSKRKKKVQAREEEGPEEKEAEEEKEEEAPKKGKEKGKAKEPEPKGKTTTNTRQAMTDQELLAALSPELRATINRSVQRDKYYKGSLLERLTGHLDDEQKEKLLAVYNALDIEALELMIAAQPAPRDTFPEEEGPALNLPNYLGASGAPFTSNRSRFSDTDDLDMVPPTVNAREESERDRRAESERMAVRRQVN